MKAPKSSGSLYSSFSAERTSMEHMGETPTRILEQHTLLTLNSNFSNTIVESITQPHGQQLDSSLLPTYQQLNSSMPLSFSTAIHSVGNIENDTTHLSSVSNISSYGNIPFVQIHTTDVHPPSKSFGNIFRRETSSSNAEIKSEPIKSESTEAASKERSNTTPTPPVRDSRCSSRGAVTPSSNQNEMSDSSLQETDKSVENFPNVHKCANCPFISLSEAGIKTHKLKNHSTSGSKKSNLSANLQCPGCQNMFCVYDSLEVHLRKDHQMSVKELKILIDVYKRVYSNVENGNKNSKKDITSVPVMPSQSDPQHKSRIYLKNVDCLREPTREPIEQQENQIIQQTSEANSCELQIMNSETPLCTNDKEIPLSCGKMADAEKPPPQAPKKQKISIKSVEMLREPALLHRDYCFIGTGSGMNTQNHFNFPLACGNTNESNACENRNPIIPNDTNESEKPRRPKIYVKHGDVLKEPLLFSSPLNALNMQRPRNDGGFNFLSPEASQKEVDFLDDVDSLNNTSQIFEPTLAQLSFVNMPDQYIFENNNHSFFQSATEDGEFGFTCDVTSTENYSNRLDCPTSASSSSTTPIITEATPPPPPMLSMANSLALSTFMEAEVAPQPQQQKIFIKSFDHLKEPQALETRGMLHLRTVDELNLMNKNDVQDLIAPNLDNAQHGMMSDLNDNYNNPNEEAKALEQSVPGDDSIKFDGLGWVDEYADYDLGDDIDCIIIGTEETVPSTEMLLKSTPKLVNDLETPQVSLISVRDIEALTDGQQQTQNSFPSMNEFNVMPESDNDNETTSLNVQEETPESEPNYQSDYSSISSMNDGTTHTVTSNAIQSLPQQPEIRPQQMRGSSVTISTQPIQSHATDLSRPFAIPIIDDVPPLAPVSKLTTDQATDFSREDTINNISVPPLVPVPPLVLLNSQTQTGKIIAEKSKVPAERGRIYVANNLLAVQAPPPPEENISQNIPPLKPLIGGGTSVRGRPFGLKQTIATQTDRANNIIPTDSSQKCNVKGCNFRFMMHETLEYHIRCHMTRNNTVSANEMQCPECKSTDFSNWNTLHTHLWRCHLIDMELYSCHLCSFKTPLYSHLKNTHLKTHSNERNYKCDECGKAFKNARQLKNHRRHHRTQTKDDISLKLTLHTCTHCGSVFKHLKSLREHLCKHNEILSCKKCGHISSSKSSLKLHMRQHEETKRFVCGTCGHTTNDHNVFRRHKMTHDSKKMYCCPLCDYKSIQSFSFQKHVQQKHPEHADEIIHKCNKCNFSSVSKTLLRLHLAKHDMQTALSTVNNECESVAQEEEPLVSEKIPNDVAKEVKVTHI